MGAIRNLMQYFSKDVQSQIQPKTSATQTNNSWENTFKKQTRTQSLLERYVNVYEKGGMISEAFDIYPLFMFSKGYQFVSDDQSAIDACQEFVDGFDFNECLHMSVVGSHVCGDSFQEIATGSGSLKEIPVALLQRDPTQFNIKMDPRGLVEGYEQVVSFDKKIPLEPDDLFHVQLIPSLRGGYGTSLMGRCFDEIARDTQIVDGLTAAIKRHGTPKHIAGVTNPDGTKVPQTVLDTITDYLSNLNSRSVIAVDKGVQVNTLDSQGIPGVEAYTEMTLIRLFGAIGVPGELLGYRQGTTDNTAVSRIGAFLQKCETFQTRFARQLNLQVFDRVVGTPGLCKIEFGGLKPSEIADKAAWITNLMKADPLDPYAIAPLDWIREQLEIEVSTGPVRENEYFRSSGRSLGGPGSGNFDHPGRPGEVGGSGEGGGGGGKATSKDIDTAMKAWQQNLASLKASSESSYNIRKGVYKGFAEKHDDSAIEHMILLSEDNKIMGALQGNENSVSIPKDTVLKDMHLVHNHPGETYPSLSPADITVAIKNDMASISATGRHGISILERPGAGWPKIEGTDVDSVFKGEVTVIKPILDNYRDSSGRLSEKYLSMGLKQASESTINKLGLKMKYVKR